MAGTAFALCVGLITVLLECPLDKVLASDPRGHVGSGNVFCDPTSEKSLGGSYLCHFPFVPGATMDSM